MTRLALLTPNFPPVLGGMQTYSYELARHLAPHCRFLLVTTRAEGDEALDRSLPFEVVRLPAYADNMAVSAIAPLQWILRKHDIDVVLGAHWSAAFAALPLRGKRRVYSAAHGKELLLRPLERMPAAQRAYDFARMKVMDEADGFFPVSRYTATLLEMHGVERQRIHVVRNGVDPEVFRPVDGAAIRRSLGITPSQRVLLTIARLVGRKGVDTVLRALPAVRAIIPNVVYVVVGTGPEEEKLRSLAATLGVEDIVTFAGRAETDSLPSWYAACDVFVMPPRSATPDVEGFGLVFLEASACERAVVGSRSGGVPDAIVENETGLLVEEDDPIELGEALIRLLTDDALRTRMGKQGRAHVLAEGTWEHAAQHVLAVINDSRS